MIGKMSRMMIVDDPLAGIEPGSVPAVSAAARSSWVAGAMAQLPVPLEDQSLRSRLLGSVTEPYWGRVVWNLERRVRTTARSLELMGFYRRWPEPEVGPPLVRIWSRSLGQWIGPSHREITLRREEALVLPEGLAQEIYRLRPYLNLVLIESVESPRLAVFHDLGSITGRTKI